MASYFNDLIRLLDLLMMMAGRCDQVPSVQASEVKVEETLTAKLFATEKGS
jgi:hypothetical protein